MAIIIPNSTSTTGGNPYSSLDQAEPDSLDFEIAGNVGRGGVLEGCVVSTTGSSSAVAVGGGIVVVDGVSYTVDANPALALASAPSDLRFDIIVARVSGSTVSIVPVAGPESVTNPVYPVSASLTGGLVNLDTDTVLAAVYRNAGGVITSKEIVDKRAMLSSTVQYQGTSVPSDSYPDGTLFFLTNEATTGTGVQATGLYIKASGTYIQVAQNNEFGTVPAGMSMTYRGASIPTGWLLEDGASLVRATYPALFAAIGTTWGDGDSPGTTFALPNSLDRYARGSTTLGVGGSNGFTVGTANMPAHSHTQTHTHSMQGHSHTVDSHSHSFSMTGGSHTHSDNLATVNHNPSSHPHGVLGPGNSFVTRMTATAGGSNEWTIANSGGAGLRVHYGDLTTDVGASSGHQHTLTGGVQTSTSHSHSGTTGNTGPGTGGPSSGSTGGASASNTGSVGSGTAINHYPQYINGQPLIKAY